jgi:hypothetical protein
MPNQSVHTHTHLRGEAVSTVWILAATLVCRAEFGKLCTCVDWEVNVTHVESMDGAVDYYIQYHHIARLWTDQSLSLFRDTGTTATKRRPQRNRTIVPYCTKSNASPGDDSRTGPTSSRWAAINAPFSQICVSSSEFEVVDVDQLVFMEQGRDLRYDMQR